MNYFGQLDNYGYLTGYGREIIIDSSFKVHRKDGFFGRKDGVFGKNDILCGLKSDDLDG